MLGAAHWNCCSKAVVLELGSRIEAEHIVLGHVLEVYGRVPILYRDMASIRDDDVCVQTGMRRGRR